MLLLRGRVGCCCTLRPQDYTDWRVLQQQFGMQSFAAVPLMVAGTVHGVIMAAAAGPNTFSVRCAAFTDCPVAQQPCRV